jgi:hypothetical protein
MAMTTSTVFLKSRFEHKLINLGGKCYHHSCSSSYLLDFIKPAATMMPKENTMSFATATASFQPISSQPTDDNLTALWEILYPLLLEIPYDELGTHNLIGIIKATASYMATWGAAFPIPVCPPTYPIIANDVTPVVCARAKAEHVVLVWDYASS